MIHTIPSKRHDDEEVKHVLQLKDGTEFLMTLHISSTGYNIYVGGPESYCIHAYVNKPGNVFEGIDGSSSDTAYILNLYYESTCALNKEFAKGVDTRNIFLLTLSLLHSLFKKVKFVNFTDKSMKECDNGTFISLSLMHYLQDGHTWYQHQFGATMGHDDSIKLNASIKRLKESNISWEFFYSHINTELPIAKEKMKILFESAEDMFDFFHKLYNDIKVSKFCIFLSPWIETFMNKYFGFHFDKTNYTISLENPKLLPFLQFELLRYDPEHKYENNTRARKRSRSRRRGLWL